MDFNSLELVVADYVDKYQFQLNEVIAEENVDKYTDIEISDAHERLGVVQFYHGDFVEAHKNLEASLRPQYLEHKSPRSIVLTNILLASLNTRFGMFERAEQLLSYSVQMSESMNSSFELVPILLSNLAIVLLHQKRDKDAVLKAREAITSAAKLFPLNSNEYLNHVRVLLSLYLRLRQLDKAESLVAETAFDQTERCVILSGIKYSLGETGEALNLLENEKYNLTAVSAKEIRAEEQDRRVRHLSEGNFAGLRKSFVELKNDDDFNNEILHAMVSYNMSVISAKGHVDFAAALQAMEDFVTNLRTRRYDSHAQAKFNSAQLQRHRDAKGVLSKPVELYNDPYNAVEWDQHPAFLSFDAYFYPVTVLSTLLSVKAEHTLMNTKFSKGYEVSLGQVPRDMHQLSSLMKDVDAQYKESLAPVALTLLDEEPSLAEPSADDDAIVDPVVVDGAKRGDDLSVVNEEGDEEVQVPPQQPPEPMMNDSVFNSISILEEGDVTEAMDTDYPDLSLLKDSVQNYQLMNAMRSGETINAAVQKATSDYLLSSYNINISNTTGQIIPAMSMVPPSPKKAPPAVSNKPVRKTSMSAKDDSSSAGGKKSSKDAGSVASVESAATPIEKPRVLDPYSYQSEKHDQTSMRAEIMLLINKFGRDENATFIQWALSNIGGISLGILGQSIPNAVEVHGLLKPNAAYATPVMHGVAISDQFTLEIRKRLRQIDSLLVPNFNGVSSVYDNGVLETKMLLAFILCKVTVQLNMKDEVPACLAQLETLVDLLHAKYNNAESTTYRVLVERYKYEYLEWCTPQGMADDKLLSFLIVTMLPPAKRYLSVSQTAEDIYLRRDGYKKLINLYTEIGRIPQFNGGAKWPPVSMEQLEAMSPEAIENNEANNYEWLQMFGKLRAKQNLVLMRALELAPGAAQ